MDLNETILTMGQIYRADPAKAVRSQAFIKVLHSYLNDQLCSRLTLAATRRGVVVVNEAEILGSHKPKDVDVSVIDPMNGPLIMVGVRSQMSSVGKNVLTYYEGIIGECIGLQDRFPMAIMGYIYLMPLRAILPGKETEAINHARYARMYDAVNGRAGQSWKNIRGVFDQFAYAIVDFDADPPALRDDIWQADTRIRSDLSIDSFMDRLITTFNDRMLFKAYFD